MHKAHLTNQGYSQTSAWARGQVWALTGFAQTYQHTQDALFLRTARACADCFIPRLPDDGVCYWNFDAPRTEAVSTGEAGNAGEAGTREVEAPRDWC